MADMSTSRPANEHAGSFWDTRVGPYYDELGVQTVAGLTDTELAAQIASNRVLAVTTDDGSLLFPVFQFGPRGESLPALPRITALLRPISDDLWDVALWLHTPTKRFGGMSAVELLHSGRTSEVLRAAERDGGILSY
jgi:hypothetical protein